MKGISLNYTPALDFLSKKAVWILLIVLIEVLIGFTAVSLKPLYVLILTVGSICVVCSMASPYFAYALLLFTLPFFTYNIMGTPEIKGQVDVKFSDVATILAVFSWLAYGLTKRNLTFEKSPVNFPLFLLYIWMFLSLFWCFSFLVGSAEIVKKLVGVAVFFLTINLVTDREKLDTTFKLWTILGVVYAFCGLIEVFSQGLSSADVRAAHNWGEAVRTSGYSTGANKFGFFLNLCLMISIPQLVTTKSFRYKIFLVFSITIMMAVLITTMSRGSWAGFIAGAAVLSFYSRGCRKVLLIGFIIALIFVLAISTTSFTNAIYERFVGLANPTVTRDFHGKPEVWKAGMKMFQDFPLRGVGIGSFKLLSTPYGATMLILPHNLYVYVLAEFGLIGTALSLLFIIVSLYVSIKTLVNLTDQTEKIILMGLITGLFIYCVQGVSLSFNFKESDMWAFFGLTIATINIYGKKPLTTQAGQPIKEPIE